MGTRAAPIKFSIQGGGVGSQIAVDITRLMFAMLTSTTPILSDFGDIPGGLTNGIVLRITNGDTRNVCNIKTNFDLQNIAYDLALFAAANPVQGIDGLGARYSFAGKDKHGVALRLEPTYKIELIIQDNLSSLLRYRMIGPGHQTEEPT